MPSTPPPVLRHRRYTIVSKLADGGMAEIFLGVQRGAEGFEKPVVLKRIHARFAADAQFRDMLLDEAHISMSLQHSNIAQVLDLGVANGSYFLAFELVDGWDLERILERAEAAGVVLPAALALYVTAAVCRALAYAHAKTRAGAPLGIVHRDISPHNVLVSEQGEVKLADFGIAKARQKREQTGAGVIKGKVAHMSPEQALGAAVDHRSDLFALGAMLYRMTTRRLPFEAATDTAQLLRVQKAEYPRPQEVEPRLTDAVAAVIERAMRLNPAERYQTAEELLFDVERVLRNDLHSAGQTELKLWLEALGQRDGVPSVGKLAVSRAADRNDDDEDRSGAHFVVGTSLELGDLAAALATSTTEIFQTPPPVMNAPGVTGEPASKVAHAPAAFAQTAMLPLPRRRLEGFWLGAAVALVVALGAQPAARWLGGRPFARSVARVLGGAAPPPLVSARMSPVEAADAVAAPVPEIAAPPSAAAGPPPAPTADDAPEAASEAEAPRSSAAVHITTVPSGVLVRTKARVLGRTPSTWRFNSGTTYELTFSKPGYEPARRRVTIRGTRDRKIALVLKR